jgi:hypothetical protein
MFFKSCYEFKLGQSSLNFLAKFDILNSKLDRWSLSETSTHVLYLIARQQPIWSEASMHLHLKDRFQALPSSIKKHTSLLLGNYIHKTGLVS